MDESIATLNDMYERLTLLLERLNAYAESNEKMAAENPNDDGFEFWLGFALANRNAFEKLDKIINPKENK